MPAGPLLAVPDAANRYQQDFITRVAASFARVTGRALPSAEAREIYFGDYALLTHRGDAAATLNYGNPFALALWECDWEKFIATPSAATAPAEAATARDGMMARVARDNFVKGYAGLRISTKGRLFRIEDAVIWRLLDDDGEAFGVGAYFPRFTYL